MTADDVRPWNGPLYSEDCDPRVQAQTQARLDDLYLRDGRDRPEHPDHCTYTGLADKYGTSEDTSNDD